MGISSLVGPGVQSQDNSRCPVPSRGQTKGKKFRSHCIINNTPFCGDWAGGAWGTCIEFVRANPRHLWRYSELEGKVSFLIIDRLYPHLQFVLDYSRIFKSPDTPVNDSDKIIFY